MRTAIILRLEVEHDEEVDPADIRKCFTTTEGKKKLSKQITLFGKVIKIRSTAIKIYYSEFKSNK